MRGNFPSSAGDDEGPYEDLLTALQGTFLGSPPREMDAAALTKVEEFYPDEAKELMAMSPNKLDNIIAMAWPTGFSNENYKKL